MNLYWIGARQWDIYNKVCKEYEQMDADLRDQLN